MLNKLHILALALAWFLSGVFAWAGATPKLLRFDPAVIEIGEVRFDGGTVKVRFNYTNIADKPVTVVEVHPMCGCTVPTWDHKSVKPGKSAYIDVEYDPFNFIGEQNAHLTVISSNGEYERLNTITIHGKVLRDETLLQIRHPYTLAPGLRCEVEAVGLRLRNSRETVHRDISFLNDSDREIRLGFKGSWRVRVEAPATVAPHKAVVVKLSYRTWFKRSGKYEEPLDIYIDGIKVASLPLKGAIE